MDQFIILTSRLWDYVLVSSIKSMGIFNSSHWDLTQYARNKWTEAGHRHSDALWSTSLKGERWFNRRTCFLCKACQLSSTLSHGTWLDHTSPWPSSSSVVSSSQQNMGQMPAEQVEQSTRSHSHHWEQTLRLNLDHSQSGRLLTSAGCKLLFPLSHCKLGFSL
jgi:hypothetical protein